MIEQTWSSYNPRCTVAAILLIHTTPKRKKAEYSDATSHLIKYAPVHVEVMELVCCPAKRAAINRPVHSSSVVDRPNERYLESMKAWSMSGSDFPDALRALMMAENIPASSFLALSKGYKRLPHLVSHENA